MTDRSGGETGPGEGPETGDDAERGPDLDALRERYERIVARDPYYDWLGVRPASVRRGRVVGELPFDERLTTPRSLGTSAIHGGAIATLIDLAAAGAALTTADPEDRATVATTGLDVSFHRAVRETLTATAAVTDRADARRSVSVVVTAGPAGAVDAGGAVGATAATGVGGDGNGDGAVATAHVTCRVR